MQVHQLKREYDIKREKIRVGQIGNSNNVSYRHAILNEVSVLLSGFN